ncbi:sulfotransferase [Gloeocapsopsis sp. AAB1 = 1H9]|uniref:Sulfotransferase n=3 Tax=Gloeocapsopsis TaxID=693222 RepID=A0A6N8G4I2_9CHRO|nr:sulfotransferase [Gloeocapsopsis dulcis AAB1 = 1H9]WNN91900.1 sulfotransferase [Gloeocapsopsis dulcis]
MSMPDFLIIGAQKAGTSSLYYYLKQHPQIYMSPIKELHFFTYEGEKSNRSFSTAKHNESFAVVDNIEDYQKIFQAAPESSLVGEASPSYIYAPKAAERIKYHIPNAKLIAILRHPAERAYSNFLHAIRQNHEPLQDFKQALQQEETRIRDNSGFLWHYKSKGFYYKQLSRYLDLFDRSQIKICLYEDLKTNPVGVVKDLFEFLEVDSSFEPDVSRKYNVSVVPKNLLLNTLITNLKPIKPALKTLLPDGVRHYIRSQVFDTPPPISPEMRKQLIEGYREDILQMQDLLGRDLSGWLK